MELQEVSAEKAIESSCVVVLMVFNNSFLFFPRQDVWEVFCIFDVAADVFATLEAERNDAASLPGVLLLRLGGGVCDDTLLEVERFGGSNERQLRFKDPLLARSGFLFKGVLALELGISMFPLNGGGWITPG